jgi:hypothetical protein
MTEPDAEFNRRRKSRSLVTGLILAAFVVLVFFISIAKMQVQ